MIDPGWDLWDAKRVRTTLWLSTEDWSDGNELWPEVAISPPDERSYDAIPIARVTSSRSRVRCGSPTGSGQSAPRYVKIGRTQYQADRDGR